jgi:hypothetical protein
VEVVLVRIVRTGARGDPFPEGIIGIDRHAFYQKPLSRYIDVPGISQGDLFLENPVKEKRGPGYPEPLHR